jgi:hypothetical protein
VVEDLLVGIVIADRVAEVSPLPHANSGAIAVTDELNGFDQVRDEIAPGM